MAKANKSGFAVGLFNRQEWDEENVNDIACTSKAHHVCAIWMNNLWVLKVFLTSVSKTSTTLRSKVLRHDSICSHY